MINKKDNLNIFTQYRKVILEEYQFPEDKIASLINKIKASSLDFDLKSDIIQTLNDKNNDSKSPEKRYADTWWDQQTTELKNKSNQEFNNKTRDDDENAQKLKKFGDMMADPSKRPRVLSDKADAIEKDYESKVAALKEKYKNIKPEFNDAVTQRYMFGRNLDENYFYRCLDGMRAGDRIQWDLMAKGETANGLYSNDVGVVGHPDFNDEQEAKNTMRKILTIDDAYLSNNKRQFYFLMGLTDDKSGSYLDYNSDSQNKTSDQKTQSDKKSEDYEFNTKNPFEGDINLQGKNPYGDDSYEMNFSNINNVGKFKDYKGNFSNINNI